MSNAANTISLNGQDFTLKPLNFKKLKELREDIIKINGLNQQTLFDPDMQDSIVKVVHASLQRSHGDIDVDFVERHLDLGNMSAILGMVFGKNQDAAVGEARAVASTS